MQLWPVTPIILVYASEKERMMAHKHSVEASIYVFSVVQFLVDMLLNANTASGEGFLPVDLLLISYGVGTNPSQLTVSLTIVPTSRSIFRSNMLINFAESLWLPLGKKPNLTFLSTSTWLA